jgi:hypothetical protein
MITLAAAVLFVTTLALCAVPSASADEVDMNTFSDIRMDAGIVGTGDAVTYTLTAIGGDSAPRYSLKLTDMSGNTISGSTATGTITTDGTLTRTTAAPANPGTYILVVEFTFTDNDDTATVTKTAPVKVVTPIVLSATLKNESGNVVNLSVWFIVDGNKVENSDREISLNPGQEKTETYRWITDGLSGGRHTMTVDGEVGITEGAISASTTNFYVGQTSHTLIEAIVIILFIILLIILIFIIRKPVKNVGKPKSRR